MKMNYHREEGNEYLKLYPKLEKWMNTCICCGRTGYKPDLPKNITTRFGGQEFATAGAANIRRYFNPLEVNEFGVCVVCQEVMRSKQRADVDVEA